MTDKWPDQRPDPFAQAPGQTEFNAEIRAAWRGTLVEGEGVDNGGMNELVRAARAARTWTLIEPALKDDR